MYTGRDDYNRRIVDTEDIIPHDEPVFLIRAQDNTAISTINHWIVENKCRGNCCIADYAKNYLVEFERWLTRKDSDIDAKDQTASFTYQVSYSECCIKNDKARQILEYNSWIYCPDCGGKLPFSYYNIY